MNQAGDRRSPKKCERWYSKEQKRYVRQRLKSILAQTSNQNGPINLSCLCRHAMIHTEQQRIQGFRIAWSFSSPIPLGKHIPVQLGLGCITEAAQLAPARKQCRSPHSRL
uniref:Uncharacterized protein n=1 Tax=Eutreptiella gymnastica TaxID=73025 RepID=A0A7S4FFH7_9EUGL